MDVIIHGKRGGRRVCHPLVVWGALGGRRGPRCGPTVASGAPRSPQGRRKAAQSKPRLRGARQGYIVSDVPSTRCGCNAPLGDVPAPPKSIRGSRERDPVEGDEGDGGKSEKIQFKTAESFDMLFFGIFLAASRIFHRMEHRHTEICIHIVVTFRT